MPFIFLGDSVLGMSRAAHRAAQVQRRPVLQALPLAAVAAFGLVGSHTSLLPVGGLAPVAVAGLVAALVGAAAASGERQASRDDGVVEPLRRALGDLAVLLMLAASAAALPEQSRAATVVGLACTFALALGALAGETVPRLATRLAPGAGLLAVGGLVLGSVVGVRCDAAWSCSVDGWSGTTLLEPGWGAWRDWLAASVRAGLLMGLAGFGRWTSDPGQAPPPRRAPWATTGLALCLALALAVRAARRWEAGLGEPEADGLALLGLAVLVALAGLQAVLRGSPGQAPPARQWWGRQLLLLVVGVTWFAGPAKGALPFVWAVVLPATLVLALGMQAWASRGAARLTAAVAAALGAGTLVGGWPGVPSTTGAAVAAGLTAVATLWIVGTPAVLARASEAR